MSGEPNESATAAAHVSDEKAQAYIEQRLKPQLAYYEAELGAARKAIAWFPMCNSLQL